MFVHSLSSLCSTSVPIRPPVGSRKHTRMHVRQQDKCLFTITLDHIAQGRRRHLGVGTTQFGRAHNSQRQIQSSIHLASHNCMFACVCLCWHSMFVYINQYLLLLSRCGVCRQPTYESGEHTGRTHRSLVRWRKYEKLIFPAVECRWFRSQEQHCALAAPIINVNIASCLYYAHGCERSAGDLRAVRWKPYRAA